LYFFIPYNVTFKWIIIISLYDDDDDHTYRLFYIAIVCVTWRQCQFYVIIKYLYVYRNSTIFYVNTFWFNIIYIIHKFSRFFFLTFFFPFSPIFYLFCRLRCFHANSIRSIFFWRYVPSHRKVCWCVLCRIRGRSKRVGYACSAHFKASFCRL
jgi:hypothetical protein